MSEKFDWDQFEKDLEPLRQAMREINAENGPYAEASGDMWEGRLQGWVPVQGYGTIDGLPWYFRARGNSWSMSIAETPDSDPIDVRWNKASGWYYEDDYGDIIFEAGWMPYKVAWGFIKECFDKYRKGEGHTHDSTDNN